MIGTLTGTLSYLNAPELIIEVQGVGYEVMAPMTTVYQLPLVGQTIKLYIYQVIREDANLLFGFADLQDKNMFKLLLKVNGVGPKIALAILSAQTTQEVIDNVLNENTRAISAVPGIGKKTAERLVIELRDKVKSQADSSRVKDKTQVALISAQPKEEAISGLVALGYKLSEAQKNIQSVYDSELSSTELIKLALKKGLKA